MGTGTFSFQLTETYPKLIQPPFYKSFRCPWGLTYNRSLWALTGGVNHGGVIVRSSDYFDKMTHSKFWSVTSVEKECGGRGTVALRWLFWARYGWLNKEALLYDLLTILNKITILKFQPDVLGEKKMWKDYCGVTDYFWLLKRELEISISNQMSFLQIYASTPSIKSLVLLGHNLQSLCGGSGTSISPRGVSVWSLNDFEKISILIYRINAFGRKGDWGGVDKASLRSLRLLKREHKL